MLATLSVVAGVLVGLTAGLFAAFSYAVMPGLRRVDDHVFVTSMRAVNTAILNPLFALIFFGGLVAGIAAVITAFATNTAAPLGALIVGTALQAATIAITMVFNVPLNLTLEQVGATDPASARQQVEQPWTRWNHARALTATGGLAAFLWAALQF